MTHIEVDLFSLYVLFSHFRPRDGTLENCFFQMSYARASTWTSRGLNWENKTYRVKRSISLFLSSYFASKPRDKGRVLVINKIHFFFAEFDWKSSWVRGGEKHFCTDSPYDRRNVTCKPSKCELTHEFDIDSNQANCNEKVRWQGKHENNSTITCK